MLPRCLAASVFQLRDKPLSNKISPHECTLNALGLLFLSEPARTKCSVLYVITPCCGCTTCIQRRPTRCAVAKKAKACRCAPMSFRNVQQTRVCGSTCSTVLIFDPHFRSSYFSVVIFSYRCTIGSQLTQLPVSKNRWEQENVRPISALTPR